MTHSRERFLTQLILKRLKHSPVVAIQGARQTGKSFLARELIQNNIKKTIYKTLDKKSDRDFASINPDSFVVLSEKDELFIIDEVQKVPDLFDAIKATVDEDKRPGRFLILGSTEFSLLTKIREALTGRMSRARLFPLSLSESKKNSKFKDWNFSNLKNWGEGHGKRADLLKYLERGGMPGIFAIREKEVRNQMLKDWLDLTLERDLLQIPKSKLDSTIAIKIIEKIVLIDGPTAREIARSLNLDSRKVKTYLANLSALFIINPISPYKESTGDKRWYLLDVAFVSLLGGGFKRQLQTWLMNEILVKNSMRESPRSIYYYRNSKGSIIDFILEDKNELIAIQIFDRETVYLRDLNLLKSFSNKFPSTLNIALAGTNLDIKDENIFVRSWEWMS